MADVRSHQGNIYQLVQPLQPVRGGKTNIDYALAEEERRTSEQKRKQSEEMFPLLKESQQIENVKGMKEAGLLGEKTKGQQLANQGMASTNRIQNVEAQRSELNFNDYTTLREASNRSLNEFEQKLGQIDPAEKLKYQQHKENLKRTMLNTQEDYANLESKQFKNKLDKQAALGNLSLYTDNMIQSTKNPKLYDSFKPLFKYLDTNAPETYDRAYMAAGIAQAVPISTLIQQRPEMLDTLLGPRQNNVNAVVNGLKSDIGKQFGDLMALSQVPGQLGQYGQNVMQEAIDSSIKNSLQKQTMQSKAPTGYRYTDEQQSNLEPIPGGPAAKENASDAARFQLLNQAESLLPEIENLIFTKDGKLNKGNIATSNAPIKIGRGRELSRMMDMGISNIVYSLSGVAVRPEERQNYRNQFMPSPLDREDTVRNKFRDYTNFVMGAKQRIQTGRQVLQQPNANTSSLANPQTQQKMKQLKYERDRGISEGRDVTMINEWYKQELNKLTGGQ